MMRTMVLLAFVIGSMHFPRAAQAVLFGIADSGVSQIYRIDEATGQATLVADILPGNVSLPGASFLDGQLYVTDVFGVDESMGTIDTSTGVFNPTIDQGSDNWHGLASDEAAGLFYTIDIDDNRILKSVTSTGVMTSIGTGTGIDGRGMAYDDLNDILYATDDGSLYQVDTSAGTAELIGSMGIDTIRVGLAYDEDSQTLYANEGSAFRSLYSVDVNTGRTTLIGANFAVGDASINGLAWSRVPEPSTLLLLSVGLATLLRSRSAISA